MDIKEKYYMKVNKPIPVEPVEPVALPPFLFKSGHDLLINDLGDEGIKLTLIDTSKIYEDTIAIILPSKVVTILIAWLQNAICLKINDHKRRAYRKK
jgi:hypothetical protein